jgi:hypothetical protein
VRQVLRHVPLRLAANVCAGPFVTHRLHVHCTHLWWLLHTVPLASLAVSDSRCVIPIGGLKLDAWGAPGNPVCAAQHALHGLIAGSLWLRITHRGATYGLNKMHAPLSCAALVVALNQL